MLCSPAVLGDTWCVHVMCTALHVSHDIYSVGLICWRKHVTWLAQPYNFPGDCPCQSKGIHEKLHPPLRLMGFNLDIYCVSLIISVKWTRWTGRDGFQQVFCLILTPIKSSYYQNLKCIKDWTHRSPCDSLHSYCSGTCFIRSTEDADLGVILHLNDMGYLPKGAN